MAEAAPVLAATGLVAGYRGREVLHGVDVEVPAAQIVGVVGHNGAGKTTLLRSIFGLTPLWAGAVLLRGQRIERPLPPLMLRAGVVLVVQGNRVFESLSVKENLEIGAGALRGIETRQSTSDRVFEFFPELPTLLSRLSGTLSGGEKQMVALATGLMADPKVLLLDEPTLGLAPQAASRLLRSLERLRDESGIAMLVVEQRVREIVRVADRVLAIRGGRVAYSGPASDLEDPARLREVYL